MTRPMTANAAASAPGERHANIIVPDDLTGERSFPLDTVDFYLRVPGQRPSRKVVSTLVIHERWERAPRMLLPLTPEIIADLDAAIRLAKIAYASPLPFPEYDTTR